jgi:hypothetical protein
MLMSMASSSELLNVSAPFSASFSLACHPLPSFLSSACQCLNFIVNEIKTSIANLYLRRTLITGMNPSIKIFSGTWSQAVSVNS